MRGYRGIDRLRSDPRAHVSNRAGRKYQSGARPDHAREWHKWLIRRSSSARPVRLNLGRRNIRNITLGGGSTRAAVCASATAVEPVAGHVDGAGARVASGVVGLTAVLDDFGGYLLVGRRGRL